MNIGLPKEVKDSEYRVGLVPAGVHALVEDKHKVFVEKTAGQGSGFSDEEYIAAVGLRLAISGGGCSGFQYGFSLDSKTRPDDLVIERDGASMLIDGMSVALIKDSQIDWQEDIAGSMFVVKNPNATAMCGCGTSFSVG